MERPSSEEMVDLERKANEVLQDLLDPMAGYVVEKSEKLRRQMNSLGDIEFTALYIAVMKAKEDRLVELLIRFPHLRDEAIKRTLGGG